MTIGGDTATVLKRMKADLERHVAYIDSQLHVSRLARLRAERAETMRVIDEIEATIERVDYT